MLDFKNFTNFKNFKNSRNPETLEFREFQKISRISRTLEFLKFWKFLKILEISDAPFAEASVAALARTSPPTQEALQATEPPTVLVQGLTSGAGKPKGRPNLRATLKIFEFGNLRRTLPSSAQVIKSKIATTSCSKFDRIFFQCAHTDRPQKAARQKASPRLHIFDKRQFSPLI